MAQAKDLEARDLVQIGTDEVAIVKVEFVTEDETWIYATDVNGEGYEWEAHEKVVVLDSDVDPYDYIEDCKHCERPAHLCACP